MSIRFKCTACQTVLKLGSMISEPKKVRCTGCGIVIVVMPDEDDPNGVIATIPQQSGKDKIRSKEELARQRKILIAVLVILALVLAAGLWWTFSGPSDRGSVYGDVTFEDGEKIEKGEIVFMPIEGTKGAMITVPIVKGHYEISAAQGPHVGMQKVEIYGKVGTGRFKTGLKGETVEETREGVAEKFNVNSILKFEVKAGANKEDFKVQRR